MASKDKPNRSNQQAADQQLIDGFTKHAATLTSLLIAGSTVPTANLITVLLARIAASNLALSTKVPWQAAVKAEGDEITSTQTLVSGARAALKVAFEGQIQTLADFGLAPRKKPAPRTPAQKAAAAAKAKATREARHTMGPKQKAQITGETAQAAAPVVAAPAGNPAPAAGPVVTAAVVTNKS